MAERLKLTGLAEEGRKSHPNNEQPLEKRQRVEEIWDGLGLEETYPWCEQLIVT